MREGNSGISSCKWKIQGNSEEPRKYLICPMKVRHLWHLPYCNITKLLITVYSNLLFFLQPAKLAEAFKYFVQGMGYSKYWYWNGSCSYQVCWASKYSEGLLITDIWSFPCWHAFARGKKKTTINVLERGFESKSSYQIVGSFVDSFLLQSNSPK